MVKGVCIMSEITTVQALVDSVANDSEPPSSLSDPLKALWLAKAGRWHEAHEVAQDIHTPFGSWIHAHLHVMEGDLGNAGYWYRQADKPANPPGELDNEWIVLAEQGLQGVS